MITQDYGMRWAVLTDMVTFRNLKETVQKTTKRTRSFSLLLFSGVLLSIFLSFIFEPFLHFVRYRASSDLLYLSSFGTGIILCFLLVMMETRKEEQTLRKMKWQIFFGGISITSFILAGINFLTFPNSLFSTGVGWIIGTTDYVFGGVRLSQIIYFIAKTLWSILIGSFFGLLNHILTMLKVMK